MTATDVLFSYKFEEERKAAIVSLRKKLGEFEAVVPYDVTLCCTESLESNDSVSFQAHGFLLSSASPVLKDMIIHASNSRNYPQAIALIGIYQQDLKSILTYIYEGEVSISPNDIDSFRSAADSLKIKGICSETESTPVMESALKPYICEFIDPTITQLSLRAQTASGGTGFMPPPVKKPKTLAIKSEKTSGKNLQPKDGKVMKQPKPKIGSPKAISKEALPNNDEQNVQIEKTEGGGGLCLVCGTPFSIFGNCKTHYVKKHGEELPGSKNYNCLICESDPEKSSFSRFNFQVNFKEHLKLQHKVKGNLKRVAEEGDEYWILRDDLGGGYCLKCNTYFTIFGNLKTHFNKKHANQ